MNLNVLRYALEVERSRSITQAARQLFISQPNLSRDIRELEEEIGFSIFTRSSRGVMPTQRGREFLLLARKAVRQYQTLEEYCAREETDRLTLQVCMPASPLISSALDAFLVRYGRGRRLNIRYQETQAMEAIERTILRDCSFSVIYCPARQSGTLRALLAQKELACEILGSFEPLVLFSEHHPLAGSETLTRNMLEPWPEIVAEDTSLAPWLKEMPEPEDTGREESPDTDLHSGTPSPEEASADASGAADKSRIHVRTPGIQNELLSHIPGAFLFSAPVPQKVLETSRLKAVRLTDPPPQIAELLICPEDYRFSRMENAFLEILRRTLSTAR